MENRIRAIDLLKSVGLSEYEAKVYIALLAEGEPMNGYEVAKSSGVPRSTIYEVLAKLVTRGAAVQVHGVGRSTESFAALPIGAFIDGYRGRLSKTLDGLADALPRVAAKGRTYLVQKLSGRADVVQRINDVMNRAQSHIWLQIWPDIAADVRQTTEERCTKGIEVTTVMFGESGGFPGRIVSHEYLSPAVTAEKLGCRLFLAVADHQEVVIAAAEGDVWRGMWSDDLSVTLLAAEHVRYDMTIQVLCRSMDQSGGFESLRTDPTLLFLSRSMEIGVSQILQRLSEP